jgi:hypothetical protein
MNCSTYTSYICRHLKPINESLVETTFEQWPSTPVVAGLVVLNKAANFKGVAYRSMLGKSTNGDVS